MENKNPSSDEIKKRREFDYRAFSPDSEPPSPLHEEDKAQPDPTKSEQPMQSSTGAQNNKRQSA